MVGSIHVHKCYAVDCAFLTGHADLVKAGHSWAQPREFTEAEFDDAGKLPVAWISASAEKPLIEQRLVRVRRVDRLAMAFAPLSMMRIRG